MSSNDDIDQLATKADDLYQAGNYLAAATLYQELVETCPESKLYYWMLGLSLLLQEQETEAQLCWMTALLDGDEQDVERWTTELTVVLEEAAQYQFEQNNIKNSWLIRHHLHSINSSNVENLLILISLSLGLEYPLLELISGEAGLIQCLSSGSHEKLSKDIFLSTLSLILGKSPVNIDALNLVRVSFDKVDHIHEIRALLVPICMKLAQQLDFTAAISLGELYLSVDPTDLEFLAHIPGWYSAIGDLQKSIQAAQQRILLSTTEIELIFSRHLLIKTLLATGGHWIESSREIQANQISLLNLKELDGKASLVQLLRLISTPFFAPYLQDQPMQSRMMFNHVANIFSEEVTRITPPEIKAQQQLKYEKEFLSNENLVGHTSTTRKLKIGYISHCFRRHSVGWLARWLLKYQDSSLFETYGYLINFNESNEFQGWYVNQFDNACRVGIDCADTGIDIARKIAADEIDILIDLDSITLDFTCEVMVHKPAPIQATWLGWDASGIPQIDYFIADSYVLPDNAQDYYSEKIWRLPQTYIAVDGFEISVPTISRESLGIPPEAIIYLTAQGGYKRNPEAIRLQLEILKGVPNSYLLVKGTTNLEAVQRHFFEIAEAIDVPKNRILFLPIVESEEVHRANLRIADIVLDTFPYNGATTTLETLWMEIPLVTLVGQQFAARNSYTMLKNVGVDEGIAWTEAEYVQWGIRFGTDATLRQDVAWKLRQSKKSAPLWNAKSFTRQMEKAYQQMWESFIGK